MYACRLTMPSRHQRSSQHTRAPSCEQALCIAKNNHFLARPFPLALAVAFPLGLAAFGGSLHDCNVMCPNLPNSYRCPKTKTLGSQTSARIEPGCNQLLDRWNSRAPFNQGDVQGGQLGLEHVITRHMIIHSRLKDIAMFFDGLAVHQDVLLVGVANGFGPGQQHGEGVGVWARINYVLALIYITLFRTPGHLKYLRPLLYWVGSTGFAYSRRGASASCPK